MIIPVQFTMESVRFPSESKYPDAHMLHLSPRQFAAHVQFPLSLQGQVAGSVQLIPVASKDPGMEQSQAKRVLRIPKYICSKTSLFLYNDIFNVIRKWYNAQFQQVPTKINS